MQNIDIDPEQVISQIIDLIVVYGPRVLLAFLALIIGFIVIGRITKYIKKYSIKRELDLTLSSFLISLINISLKILLLISIIQMLGIETTSFVAVLAAAGFALGMALQGSLSNFAGGMLIIFFKPYKVGDFIQAGGHSGTVKGIQIFSTILKTPDNATVIIPNGKLSNDSIVNFSTEDNRRLELVFGIGYEDDSDLAIELINELIKNDKRALVDPAPFVRITNLGPSTVDITVRVWTKRSDLWNTKIDLIEAVKKSYDKNGVSLPFPQTDVHLYQK